MPAGLGVLKAMNADPYAGPWGGKRYGIFSGLITKMSGFCGPICYLCGYCSLVSELGILELDSETGIL